MKKLLLPFYYRNQPSAYNFIKKYEGTNLKPVAPILPTPEFYSSIKESIDK
jgi:hypothetical protein